MCHTLLQHYIHCRHTDVHFYHCHVDFRPESHHHPFGSFSSSVYSSHPRQHVRVRVTHPNYCPGPNDKCGEGGANAGRGSGSGRDDPADWRSHDVPVGVAHSYLRSCPACCSDEVRGRVERAEHSSRVEEEAQRLRAWRMFAGLETSNGEESEGGFETGGAAGTRNERDNAGDRNEAVGERDEDGDEIGALLVRLGAEVIDIDEVNNEIGDGERRSWDDGGVLTSAERQLLEETRRTIREVDRLRRASPGSPSSDSMRNSQNAPGTSAIQDFASSESGEVRLTGDGIENLTEVERLVILERARAAVQELDRRTAEGRYSSNNEAVIILDTTGEEAESAVASNDFRREGTPLRSTWRREPDTGEDSMQRSRLGPRVLARQARNRDVMEQARLAEERILAQNGDEGRLTSQQRTLLFRGQPVLASIPEELRPNIARELRERRRRRRDSGIGPEAGLNVDGTVDEDDDEATDADIDALLRTGMYAEVGIYRNGAAGNGHSPTSQGSSGDDTQDLLRLLPRTFVRDSVGVLTPRPARPEIRRRPGVFGADSEAARAMYLSDGSIAQIETTSTSSSSRSSPSIPIVWDHVGSHRITRRTTSMRRPPQDTTSAATTTTSSPPLMPTTCTQQNESGRTFLTSSSLATHDLRTPPNTHESLRTQYHSPFHPTPFPPATVMHKPRHQHQQQLPQPPKDPEPLSPDTWEVAIHFEACGHILAIYVEKLRYYSGGTHTHDGESVEKITAQCGCGGFDRGLMASRRGWSRGRCVLCWAEEERRRYREESEKVNSNRAWWVDVDVDVDRLADSGGERMLWLGKWVRRLEGGITAREWVLWPFGARGDDRGRGGGRMVEQCGGGGGDDNDDDAVDGGQSHAEDGDYVEAAGRRTTLWSLE